MNNEGKILLIPTQLLLLVAAAVWVLAGLSVCLTGILAFEGPWGASEGLGAAVMFVLFGVMFFMVARRHIKRICAYTAPLMGAWKFFDIQSYVVLAIMMVMGVLLRTSGLVPPPLIAYFYVGLGSALLLAGLFYAVTYFAKSDLL